MATVSGPPGLVTDAVKALLDARPLGETDDVLLLVDPPPGPWAGTGDTVGVVVICSVGLSDRDVVDAVVAGADAVLTVDCDGEELNEVVGVVSQGGTLLSPRQTRLLADVARQAPGRPSADLLAPREIELLQHIANGHSVKQTAIAMGVSAKRIESMQHELFVKMGVRNRAHAVARAHTLGIVR